MPGEQLFTTSTANGAIVMKLDAKKIDITVSDDLKANMRATIGQCDQDVVVDMATVEFVDSSGIGALVSARKQLRGDREMHLKNISPFVERLLRTTKLDRVFVI